ncbi:MAG: hypothetical protein KAI53_00490 [Candidatus Aenigmarchaeota archaeon]|nr:hypothetical protein [Candidatus Aenigmarchaeota archaeon]
MVSKTKKKGKTPIAKAKPTEEKHTKTAAKQETKAKTNNKTDKTMPWKITTGILAILLIAVIAMPGNENTNSNALDETAAKELAETFIQSSLLGPEVELDIDDIEENNGLYALNLTVTANGQAQKATSYLSLDGKMFFVQGMNIDEVKAQAKEVQEPVAAAPTEYPKADKPTLEVYTMSFCPYGMQANKLTAPVAEMLSSVANIEPHWVIYGTEYYAGQEETYCVGDFCSMHGKYEVEENVRQMCVWENNPDKYWDYTLYIAENCNKANLDTCWKDAADSVSVSVSTIETCATNEGLALLAAEKALNEKNGVGGSEHLRLNDMQLSMSDYRWSSEKLKTLICNSFNDAPEICGQTIDESETATAATTGSC